MLLFGLVKVLEESKIYFKGLIKLNDLVTFRAYCPKMRVSDVMIEGGVVVTSPQLTEALYWWDLESGGPDWRRGGPLEAPMRCFFLEAVKCWGV